MSGAPLLALLRAQGFGTRQQFSSLIVLLIGSLQEDDPQIRVTLQRRGAGIILNVGTNTQWLSVSRHEVALIREGGPCVGCFYLSNEQAPRRARESTVSFVVALVGAMLGGELMKSYCFPQHALANSWLGNVFAPAGGRSLLRPATPNCETCSVIRN